MNGKRIAHDDRFLAELAESPPNIYFQFDGFDSEGFPCPNDPTAQI